MLSLEELKQIFKEQEEQENQATAKAEQIRVERLELEQRKQEHREKQDAEKLAILKAREQRAKEKEQQAQKQKKTNDIIYVFSVVTSFLILLVGFILLFVITLKY